MIIELCVICALSKLINIIIPDTILFNQQFLGFIPFKAMELDCITCL